MYYWYLERGFILEVVAKEFVGRTLKRTNVKGIWVYAQPLAPTWIRLPNMGRVRILLGGGSAVACVHGRYYIVSPVNKPKKTSAGGIRGIFSQWGQDNIFLMHHPKVIRPDRM